MARIFQLKKTGLAYAQLVHKASWRVPNMHVCVFMLPECEKEADTV